MFGLEPDTVAKIQQVFSKFENIEKVILYGSRAKGNCKKGSDIDLSLIGKDLNLNNSIYPINEELEELNLPYTFDISIFSNIDNEDLREHIERVGKVFHQK